MRPELLIPNDDLVSLFEQLAATLDVKIKFQHSTDRNPHPTPRHPPAQTDERRNSRNLLKA